MTKVVRERGGGRSSREHGARVRDPPKFQDRNRWFGAKQGNCVVCMFEKFTGIGKGGTCIFPRILDHF
jgi:hypothetical protein